MENSLGFMTSVIGFIFISVVVSVKESYGKRGLYSRYPRACICRPLIRIQQDRTCQKGIATLDRTYQRGIATVLKKISNVKCRESSTSISRARDCAELRKKGNVKSGVYTIYPTGLRTTRPANVYCDMTTNGGGWTVFQRRFDGTVDFYRGWTEYAAGFGDPHGEYWLGNDAIHDLTHPRPSTLRIDVEDWHGKRAFARYDQFTVGNSRSKYRLLVAKYSGTAGDSLTHHNGYPFSTKDNDNDGYKNSCAVVYHGAWWYSGCHASNLNGRYYFHAGNISKGDGVDWRSISKGKFNSVKRSEMKVRPRGF